MVPEASVEQTDYGMAPTSPGWFTVNVRDAAWMRNEAMGYACIFEGEDRFEQVGYTIAVIQPGMPSGMYHHESNQEDFLVLSGECVLLVEGEERTLRAWDFFHAPPGCDHIFVGAGDGPCVILMAGARTNSRDTTYVRHEVALRHGAGVEADTTDSKQAYAPYPKWEPGPPDEWGDLPWGLS